MKPTLREILDVACRQFEKTLTEDDYEIIIGVVQDMRDVEEQARCMALLFCQMAKDRVTA